MTKPRRTLSLRDKQFCSHVILFSHSVVRNCKVWTLRISGGITIVNAKKISLMQKFQSYTN
nr:MAG TPA: hypothetical protein [Bacteriophage sp.]